MKSFFFKVRVVSCVDIFLYADFGKNTQKILARAVFTQNGEFSLFTERVKPGRFLISNTGRL